VIFELNKVETAVVIGAGHGIGASLVKKILEQNVHARVFATYNNADKNQPLLELKQEAGDRLEISQIDPTSEIQVQKFRESVESYVSKVELLINSVGFLHEGETGPERSLRDVSSESLKKYFEVNSIPQLIVAKEFHSLFRHSEPSCMVAVSAKVGSIEDNSLGGWYGYRASKAALNMFVKGVALEYKRRGCKSLVLSIHPGTTVTELSKPFTENTHYQLHSPDETAENILKVVNNKSLEMTGRFYSWDGKEIPW
jgi:NAD(P)-dependent dehydrogenase (short-subunit alcohol dehydrogenase family)